MDFELSEDQQMLARTVSSFASKSSPVTRFRKIRDADGAWEKETWTQMGELGWLAVPFPEEAGGLGWSIFDCGLIAEALGKTLVPEPFLPSVVLGGMCLLEAGNAEQHEKYLTPMISGQTSLALAYAERASRHDLDRIEATATKDGDGYTLNGDKVFILNGHKADHIIVSAKTDAGIGLFIVDRGDLTLTSVKTIDGLGSANLKMEGLKVPAAQCLTEDGLAILDRVIDYGAAVACAEGVGMCQAMLDMTVEYMKTREQFGVKIGSFQAIQHRSVEMFVELELIRSITMLATGKAMAKDPVERKAAVSAAKAQLYASGTFVAQQAIQLHGGIGITDEHDIGLYFKRMHVLNLLFGDEAYHLERFARLPTFAPA